MITDAQLAEIRARLLLDYGDMRAARLDPRAMLLAEVDRLRAPDDAAIDQAAAAMYRHPSPPTGWGNINEDARAYWRGKVRAALAALARVPT